MKDLLRFCTSGSVDDGKSTLLGRLLFETGRIYDDQLEATRSASVKRGKTTLDLSLLLDGLESEREQGITIDVAYRYFETKKRRFIVADTPGHVQYTRNMVTGASNSSLALILVDAENGITEQTKRHAFINSLLNVPHIVVAVNKMDLVDYSQSVYENICEEFNSFSKSLNFKDVHLVPVSAYYGDNVCVKSDTMGWYQGRTILEILENTNVNCEKNLVDFRFPVQCVIRPDHTFRGFAGTVASGKVRVDEEVMILPSRLSTTVTSICHANDEITCAETGNSVVLTLADEIDISRGDMLVRRGNIPNITDRFQATVCWMSETPLEKKTYILKTNTRKVHTFINKIHYKIDVNTLHRDESDGVILNDLFKASFETTKPIFFDPYIQNRQTGSFILIDPDTNNTVACGMIKCPEENNKEVKHLSGAAENKFTGDAGHVIWMTGLSGSGKSTIASALWDEMEKKDFKTVILDGDNIRKGLCSDLGFSMEDRRENIRRIAEVCKLFAENGVNVITAFISPTREDRKMANDLIGTSFKEVYVKCSLETCEKRDPKGLYKKARSGEIPNFTGIGSPYIEPENPTITIDTENNDIMDCVNRIMGVI